MIKWEYNRLSRNVTVNKMSNLLTAGEFAKLASTTKRTIQYYDQIGILKPVQTNNTKYRFYEENQILDYQRIHLLTTLGISLDEILSHLKSKSHLDGLFDSKKELIEKEIRLLEFNLRNLIKFQSNLKKNRTMLEPKVKVMNPLEIYYIERIGPYAKIGKYCDELKSMFSVKGKEFTTLAIFEEQGYNPKNSKIKIAVIKSDNLRIKKEYSGEIKKIMFNPRKVLTYTHNGSGHLLSLFWKELERFAKNEKLHKREDFPFFEIYRKVNSDITKQYFEIYLPIA